MLAAQTYFRLPTLKCPRRPRGRKWLASSSVAVNYVAGRRFFIHIHGA